MNLLKQVGKTRVRISRRLATQHPVKVIGVLALGAMVMAGTALYFAPNSANEISAHPLNEDIQISPDDQWVYGQQDYEAALAANLARREDEARATMRRVEAYIAANKARELVEQQIDRMLAEAERDPSKNTPLFNREIERLDYQIDILRLNAMKDAPVGRPSSNENTFRIQEEQRAADREDDLRDMLQYWNQLK
jgi:hypothetical protein